MIYDFTTSGYEHLELSTQIIIREALKRGLKIRILDPVENFIEIGDDKHTEYIQEATKTSLDSYITSIILGNKWVTKVLLNESGICAPKAKYYQESTSALNDYKEHKKGKWVIKPTTSNYGIGIGILKNPSKSDYQNAIENAFGKDRSILIEEFWEGIECRFLVIGDKAVGVLHRIPANVTGDGKQTIQELVDEKNEDPRRGEGYKTPLEKIKLGPIEKSLLKAKKLSPKSIPTKRETIFLRLNSNISTGGDSIDYTDKVHETYKSIAIRASQIAGAKICGVDLILKTPGAPANSKNHTILELNYNPVLYFHDFPFKGKKRETASHILDALGF